MRTRETVEQILSGVGRMPADREPILVQTPPRGAMPLWTRLLANPRPVWLHWQKTADGWRPRPCQGQACPLCAQVLACRRYWYAPASVWAAWPKEGSPWDWRRRVQLLGDDTYGQLRGQCWIELLVRLDRESGTRAAKVLARVPATVPPEKPDSYWQRFPWTSEHWGRFRTGWLLAPHKPFNPQPYLLRAWGVRLWPDQRLRREVGAEPQPGDIIPITRRNA